MPPFQAESAFSEPRLRDSRRALVVPIARAMMSRLRNEKGFGLLELLMAMTMLNIGILALVAAFNSGAVALQRASRVSTAAALADTQMELYRALAYTAIALDSTSVNATDTLYRNDSVLGGSLSNDILAASGCTGSPIPNECNPSRTVTGADHRTYRVDAYVTQTTPANARAL